MNLVKCEHQSLIELLMKEGSLCTGVLSLCNAKYNFLYKYVKWGVK